MFFRYESDIPSGSGYRIFSATHFGCLAAIGAAMALIAIIFIRAGERKRDLIINAIPVFLICMEASKWLVLFSIHRANIGMLPLHLCGLAAFDFLLASFMPSSRARAFFGEIAVILLGPGSIFALLLPDWTLYPAWNYFNLYGYIWHEMLLLYPILLLIDKRLWPRISHLWYEAIFLAIIVPPVYIFDKITDCNYIFINWPPSDTPLSFLASKMGVPGYLAGYALLALMIMVIIYIPFEVIGRR
ncbi:YwaF family protein [Candidatus Weimeria sp. HCP3S3_B5]|uniref:YwaF family protein n=1 Tax=Candidatus Weimeria sp. HCP3S3_B5 TaxID=3438871 RepID=UPI003F8C6CDA